jgi:hypothetical protein
MAAIGARSTTEFNTGITGHGLKGLAASPANARFGWGKAGTRGAFTRAKFTVGLRVSDFEGLTAIQTGLSNAWSFMVRHGTFQNKSRHFGAALVSRQRGK